MLWRCEYMHIVFPRTSFAVYSAECSRGFGDWTEIEVWSCLGLALSLSLSFSPSLPLFSLSPSLSHPLPPPPLPLSPCPSLSPSSSHLLSHGRDRLLNHVEVPETRSLPTCLSLVLGCFVRRIILRSQRLKSDAARSRRLQDAAAVADFVTEIPPRRASRGSRRLRRNAAAG